MLAPFVRPNQTQPIITALPDARFLDPILRQAVAWEPQHTFNLARVVREGKAYVLYRAEDKTAAAAIGAQRLR